MSIHRVYQFIFRFTRRRRMRWFEETMGVEDGHRVLDVGGTHLNWGMASRHPRVVLLNRMTPGQSLDLPANVTYVRGDALQLPYADNSFDIAFSNSVIEHLGTREDQQKFADEIRRVSKAVWVQTPAFCFPLEPHFLAPIVHWLPKGWRRALLRNFTPWGWLQRPSRDDVAAMVEEIHLLRYRQVRELFPDCEILVERFLLWPKSYVVVQRPERFADARQAVAAAAVERQAPNSFIQD